MRINFGKILVDCLMRKYQKTAISSRLFNSCSRTHVFSLFLCPLQVAGIDQGGRKDETIVSREYHHHDSPSLSSGREEEDYYVELEEDEDDDGWGGFGSSGDDDDHDGFGDRASSIRRMMLEEDSDEEEEDEQGGGRGGGGGALPFYDRSPGEVYTIPEEDDEEAASPSPAWDGGQLNTDTQSSLLRWRGIPQNTQPPSPPVHHQPHQANQQPFGMLSMLSCCRCCFNQLSPPGMWPVVVSSLSLSLSNLHPTQTLALAARLYIYLNISISFFCLSVCFKYLFWCLGDKRVVYLI